MKMSVTFHITRIILGMFFLVILRYGEAPKELSFDMGALVKMLLFIIGCISLLMGMDIRIKVGED